MPCNCLMQIAHKICLYNKYGTVIMFITHTSKPRVTELVAWKTLNNVLQILTIIR